MKCRHCKQKLNQPVLDLGTSPPSNSYLSDQDLSKVEMYIPLRVHVCENCWLVQTEDYAASDALFTEEYAYFSSTSTSWLEHSKKYADQITKRLGLNTDSFVIELASNDGYLLKNFVEDNIPCLGIEPTHSTAMAARSVNVPTLEEFFGTDLAKRLASDGKQADLVIGNNVYAHVPNINDFTHGIQTVLKKGGTITLEFPHLMQLMKYGQFDTVYHEHYSYLSLSVVNRIFQAANLKIFDVEELPTHGGSLRIYGSHFDDERAVTNTVGKMLEQEREFGLESISLYQNFQARAEEVKNQLLSFLIEQKNSGKKVAAYGAAAKGNTLLNFAGVRPDLIPFVCDAAEAKQGKYLPGSRIPIYAPEVLSEYEPDYILIMPWNIKDEIMTKFLHLRESGTRFVTFIPELLIQ